MKAMVMGAVSVILFAGFRQPVINNDVKIYTVTVKQPDGTLKDMPDSAGAIVTGSNFTRRQAENFLWEHNQYRFEILIFPELSWNNTLAKEAQNWADYIKKNGGKMIHRPKKGKNSTTHGENIAMIPFTNSLTTQVPDVATAIKIWGGEYEKCKGGKAHETVTPANAMDCGHYRQMIWGATRSIGAGWADLGN